MENGKLGRMQKALDQWVQQHPEEVRRTKGAGDTKHEASRCEVCGREKLMIRLRG
jgi:hypothetical protein